MLPRGVHSWGHTSQGQIKAFEGRAGGRQRGSENAVQGWRGMLLGVGVAPLFWSLPSSPLELIQVYFCARALP